MLEFPIEFFDDEIRDGFYVPSMMKHNWASQMEILHVVDLVCKRNNIKYFIISGTLIGAVRHGGFIPWDDDIDICMLREDYMKFIDVIMKEKPEKYYVRNCHVDPNYRDIFTRILNDITIETSPEFWKKGHGFLCNAGIDIFPFDYIPQDIQRRKEISEQIIYICNIIKGYDEVGLDKDIEFGISVIEKSFDMKISRDDTIPRQLNLLLEKILCSIKRKESRAAHIALDWAQNSKAGIPLECFENSVKIPFENTTFEAPYLYDKLLSHMFGNYMHSMRVGTIHDYPWYSMLLKELKAASTLEDFKFSKDFLPDDNRHEKWKQGLVDELNENIEIFNKASDMAQTLIERGDLQSGNILLGKCQDIAFNVENLENKLNGKARERVIFFTWKAEYWKYYEPYYINEINLGNEVLVVPVPFVRVSEVREKTDEFIEVNGFPEYLKLTDIHDVDYSEVRVSRMYIQNPYDDKNGAVIMRPFFYSTNLSKYTDELIYVPWFELDEYGLDDERALYMMQYFTRMPGIIASDKIYLSESQAWLKDLYVRDLMLWAGEETKKIWEKKIELVDTTAFVSNDSSVCEYNSNIQDKDKKIILYYLGTSQVLADTKMFLKKFERNISIFEQAKEKIKVRLFIEYGLVDNLKKYQSDYCLQFCDICKKYQDKEWCEFINTEEPININGSYIHELVALSDAFYGDSGVLMHLFNRAKKPVMMQNILC